MLVKPTVGQEYVYGTKIASLGFVPCSCNSVYSPAHPCRVVVVSVGRTRAKVKMTGDTGTKMTAVHFAALHEIEEAKVMYRASLEEREAMWKAKGEKGLGQAFVDKCVEEL